MTEQEMRPQNKPLAAPSSSSIDDMKRQVSHAADTATQQASRAARDASERVSQSAAAAADATSNMADRARGAAGVVADEIRAHPVTSALIGAGVAWWLGGSSIFRRSPDDDHADLAMDDAERWDFDESASPARPRGSGATQRAASGMRRAGSEVRDRSRDLADAAQHRWQRARQRTASELDGWVDDSPLAVGAAMLAIGLTIGLVLLRPRGRRSGEPLLGA